MSSKLYSPRMLDRIRLSLLVGAAGLALVAALAATAAAAPTRGAASDAPDYVGVKTYLLARSQKLVSELNGIRARSERYYALAAKERFSYPALWRKHRAEVSSILLGLKPAFGRAHKAYEEEEGIIAGVPSLAQYDVIMDSGTSAADDPQTAVPFDLRLPNGKVLPKPGNFFHALLEPTIWGTDARFVAPGGVRADLDRDGALAFGEVLPDANVLVATARSFVSYARRSDAAARAWKPNASDVLTALVVMVPTVEGYFGEWKSSRAITGSGTKEKAFVAHSRLVDVHGILFSLQNVYDGVRPLVARAGAAQSARIGAALRQLTRFVDGIRAQERSGKRFTAKQADLLGGQAQQRANAIAGQIAQVAGVLGIELQA
jgi:uncharacterized protein YdbL (DUF1318 family)